jgi:hypothetical protein
MKHAYVVKVFRDDHVLCGEIDIVRTDGDMSWIKGNKLATEIFKSVKRGEEAPDAQTILKEKFTHTPPKRERNDYHSPS